MSVNTVSGDHVPYVYPEETIKSREDTHGRFERVSDTAQQLKETLRNATGWDSLMNCQQESIDLICTKLGRIVNGDCNFRDHWHDISGYATLIDLYLKEN